MYANCSVNTSTNIALIWNLLVEADSYWVTNRWAKSLGYSRYVPSTNEQAILGGIEPCGMRFYLSTQNRLQLKMLYFWNLLLNIFRSWLTIGNTNNGGKKSEHEGRVTSSNSHMYVSVEKDLVSGPPPSPCVPIWTRETRILDFRWPTSIRWSLLKCRFWFHRLRGCLTSSQLVFGVHFLMRTG